MEGWLLGSIVACSLLRCAGDKSSPDENKRGIIPNAFQHIFSQIDATQGVLCGGGGTPLIVAGKQFLVRASYLEIYMEDIRDLLSKDHDKKLKLHEKPDSGVYVKACTIALQICR